MPYLLPGPAEVDMRFVIPHVKKGDFYAMQGGVTGQIMYVYPRMIGEQRYAVTNIDGDSTPGKIRRLLGVRPELPDVLPSDPLQREEMDALVSQESCESIQRRLLDQKLDAIAKTISANSTVTSGGNIGTWVLGVGIGVLGAKAWARRRRAAT